MYRLFTLEEANDLIPTVDGLLLEMQAAAAEILRLRQQLSLNQPKGVRAYNLAQEIAFLVGQLQASKAELDRLGVHVKDAEAGLVDFPTQLGAEVVCLTHAMGQDGITHYHRLGDNHARPLPASHLGAAGDESDSPNP